MSMAEHVNLDQASDEDLVRRVREIMAEMAPLEEALGRLRVQIQQVASEQKKRERSQHLKARMQVCLLYTSPSPRDLSTSRMPSSA